MRWIISQMTFSTVDHQQHSGNLWLSTAWGRLYKVSLYNCIPSHSSQILSLNENRSRWCKWNTLTCPSKYAKPQHDWNVISCTEQSYPEIHNQIILQMPHDGQYQLQKKREGCNCSLLQDLFRTWNFSTAISKVHTWCCSLAGEDPDQRGPRDDP